MIRYLDTSAAAKLLVDEPETAALRSAAREWVGDDLVAAQLMATELHRLAALVGLPGSHVDAALAAVELVDVEREDFLVARTLEPHSARTLDALHVAVAARIGADLLVTYDLRQADLARSLGIEVDFPQ